ncbi:MAG TPA: LPS export ABC transporter permease LptG, partial [Xanthomonadales bacterium]|nr:LPS export ABC transporter permease LptG [Xanthomonadales bacterium]
MALVKRVDRLIAASVVASIGIVWLVLLAIDGFSALAREVDEIGRGSYSLATAVGYIAWTIPRRAYDLFGTASVIGALLGLGALAPTAELTAMRAGGMSKWRIAASATGAVALLCAATMLMGETIGPYGEHRAQSLAAGAKSDDLIATGRTGVWAREGQTLINAHGGTSTPEGVQLTDVRLYEFTRGGQLSRITHADSALHREGSWSLTGVLRQTFGEDRVEASRAASLAWPSTLDPRLLTLSIVRPRNLSAADLATGIEYLRRNQLDTGPYEAAYWNRVFYPLNVLALVLAALPFAFGTLRSGGLGK